MNSPAVRPKIAAFYCVYDDPDWLACSYQSIYDAVDAIYFFISDVPWNGPITSNQRTYDCIATFSDPENKIVIIEGHWDDQVKERNEALARLTCDGFQYAFIIDADEIYDTESLKNMINFAYASPEVGCWHAHFIVFWKSPRYCINPPEKHNPPIIIKLGTGGFVEFRNPVCYQHELIPGDIGVCFHMSYARTDEQIKRKITSCSFAPLVREGWYEDTWKAWDNDPSIRDLCPYNPGAFEKAEEIPFRLLPKVLRDYITQQEQAKSDGTQAPAR